MLHEERRRAGRPAAPQLRKVHGLRQHHLRRRVVRRALAQPPPHRVHRDLLPDPPQQVPRLPRRRGEAPAPAAGGEQQQPSSGAGGILDGEAGAAVCGADVQRGDADGGGEELFWGECVERGGGEAIQVYYEGDFYDQRGVQPRRFHTHLELDRPHWVREEAQEHCQES